MPYFMIDDFRAGLDVTQPAFKAPPGTLREGVNGHITRGGDFEKRKAFVASHTLPAGTFSLAAVADDLYVFGSIAAPAVPPGVTYVQIAHPSASPLVKVFDTELFNGKVYVTALYGNDDILHWYDGVQVAEWFDGRASGSFDVQAGATGTITSILVDGIEALGATVTWTTSNSNTAALIAAQINLFSSSPEYTAVAVGSTVYVQAPVGSGADYNGKSVVVAVTGDLSTSTPTDLGGGVTSPTAFQPGSAIRTHKNKMNALSGVNWHYSAIGDPTHFQTSYVGAGASNLANETAGAEELIGLEIYFSNMVIFARRHFQIWAVDADPGEYSNIQSTRGVGLVAPRALTAYVESGVFFLSELGIRALENKYQTEKAGIVDIGASIDPLVTAQMNALDEDVLERALMAIEPQEGRIWVVIDDVIYVYSIFPSKKVSAWTTYEPGFAISEIAVSGKKLYARSGDTIYLYGGSSGDEYDDCEVRARIPNVSMRAPATFKDLQGMDFGIEGEWTISVYPDLTLPDEAAIVAIQDGPSFNDWGSIDVAAYASHFSVGLVHQKAEYARFSMIGLHYKNGEVS